MKDYYHYNFNAIRGAYVEMEIAPTENPTIHATINGLVVYQDPTSILVLRNSGTVTCFLRSEIVPGSLSAKIKVEDMSVKQLKRLTEKEKECFGEDEDVLVVLCMKQETIFFDNGKHALYRGRRFDGYIDCTEWGWKHE